MFCKCITSGFLPRSSPFAKLRSYGYVFNAKGELRQVDPESGEVTDKKFAFNVKDGDQEFNQKRYEDIGDIITECVYEYLQQEPLNLKVKKPLYPPSRLFPNDLFMLVLFILFCLHNRKLISLGAPLYLLPRIWT